MKLYGNVTWYAVMCRQYLKVPITAVIVMETGRKFNIDPTGKHIKVAFSIQI